MLGYTIKRFGDTSRYRSDSVAIATDRHCKSNGALEVGTFQEANDGLRYGYLAGCVKCICLPYGLARLPYIITESGSGVTRVGLQAENFI